MTGEKPTPRRLENLQDYLNSIQQDLRASTTCRKERKLLQTKVMDCTTKSVLWHSRSFRLWYGRSTTTRGVGRDSSYGQWFAYIFGKDSQTHCSPGHTLVRLLKTLHTGVCGVGPERSRENRIGVLDSEVSTPTTDSTEVLQTVPPSSNKTSRKRYTFLLVFRGPPVPSLPTPFLSLRHLGSPWSTASVFLP